MSHIRRYRPFIVFSIIILALITAGCTVQKNYLYYVYDLRVFGLDNFTTDNGTFSIYVPIPAYNGTILIEPYMLPERIQKGPNITKISAPGFELNITDSPYGKMYLCDGTLSDPRVTRMYRIYDMRETKSKNRVEALQSVDMMPQEYMQAPLTPLTANGTDTGYTRWINGSNVRNFTTYVYIDGGLKPIKDNASIELVLMYEIHPKELTRNGFYISKNQRRVSEWSDYASGGDGYYMCTHEVIPANVTGYIPIKVQCIDYSDYHRFSKAYYPVSIV